MGNRLNKEDVIVVADRVEALMDLTWSYGERLIKKYYLDNLDSVMSHMDSDTYQDIKDMYELSKQLRDVTVVMARQMDQLALTNCVIVNQNNELLEKIEFLSEEIDSLKSSKTKKKLDEFKKGLNDLAVEVDED